MRTYRRASRAARAAAVTSMVSLLLAAGCSTMLMDSAGEQETVRIGVDLELSGDGAALGSVYRNALELRVEQLNREGALGNRRLELVVHDNHSDPGTTAANLTEMMADDTVAAAITGGCTSCLLANVETIEEARLAVISLAPASEVVSPVEERRSIFQLAPDPGATASAIGQQLDDADVETLALIATDDEYGADGVAAINDLADNREELEIVVEAQLPHEAEQQLPDLARQVAEYQPAFDGLAQVQPPTGPDAVVVWGAAPFGSDVAAGLRSAGYDGPLYLDQSAGDELFLTSAESDALSGATMISTETLVIDEVIATSPAKAARKTWFNEYSARYGTYHAAASFAADALGLIAEAIRQVDSADREAVRTALESIQLDGLSGPLRMTRENHAAVLPQALAAVVVRGDRWQLAG